MHEILLAIKLVKFYAWEKSFSDQIVKLRKKELSFMNVASLLKSVNLMLAFFIPPAMAVGIFAVYVLALGNTLTSSLAFTTLSLFNTLRFPLIVLPRAVRALVEGISSVKKIESFLLMDELKFDL